MTDTEQMVVRQPGDRGSKEGLRIGILVHNGHVFEEPEFYERERARKIATELQALTGATRVEFHHIDPTVGAGTNGLAFFLEFLDVGADIIAWTVAITAISPRIRKAVAHLRQLSGDGLEPVTVSLTAEAIQVLVAAEVCARSGLEPSALLKVECLSHEIEPPEPAPELKQLFAAHTVAVEAVGEDHYHHVWVYTVSPRGKVLAESEVRVPIPNATQWGWPEPTPGRRLDALRW